MSIVHTLRQRQRVNSMANYLTKEAMSDAGKAFTYTLAGGLGGSMAAYAIPAALESIQAARVRTNKEKLINKMKSAHPELKNFSKKDTDLVYNSLALHAPKVLKDPLVGGQVMLEALRRGNHMDIGQLSNVSKMTGGSGISEHQRDAANMFAQQVSRASENYAKDKFNDQLGRSIKVEEVRGSQMRKTERYKKVLEAKGGYAASRAKEQLARSAGGRGSAERKDAVKEMYTQRAKYRAYKKAKST